MRREGEGRVGEGDCIIQQKRKLTFDVAEFNRDRRTEVIEGLGGT